MLVALTMKPTKDECELSTEFLPGITALSCFCHRQSIMQKRLVKPALIFLAPLFVCFFFSFSVLLRKHPDFEAKTQCLSTLAGVSTVQFVVHYCSQHHRY